MKKILCIAMFINFLFADSIYFMPYDAKDALKALTNELRNAKDNVKIAIYSFTNREISKAIRDSAKRGVKYTIIFDYKTNIDSSYSMIGYLAKLNNIHACTLKGRLAKNNKYNGIMHNKLTIIDDEIIIFGSANWSKNAFELNYENMLVSTNKDYISKAGEYFNKMLGECEAF